MDLIDKTGIKISERILYMNASLEESPICFLDSYENGRAIFRYTSGGTHPVQSPMAREFTKNLVPIPNSERYFESARDLAYSLAKPQPQKDNKPNLNARKLPADEEYIERAEKDLPGLIQKGIDAVKENFPEQDLNLIKTQPK